MFWVNSAFDIIYDEPIEAKIWFSADQSRYIKERKWAKEQKITKQKDGSIIFDMKTSGWYNVKRWIMSFGADAKVLEPKELRKDIIRELKAAANNYKKH
ncbi:MAG: WYL domain-containing protein [Nitrospinota bacterium]